jgi:ribosomal protein L29
MKKNQIQELKNKSGAELERLAKELQVKLRGLRFDLAAGKIKNVNELRNTKKQIARVLTFLTINATDAKKGREEQ